MSNEAPNKTPRMGTIWRHRASGALYLVYDVTNTLRGKKDYPIRISYMDSLGNRFSRKLPEWEDRYEPVTTLDGLERGDLESGVLAAQGCLDRLHLTFLNISVALNRRIEAAD